MHRMEYSGIARLVFALLFIALIGWIVFGGADA